MKYIAQTFIWVLAGMLLLSCTEKGKRPESKLDYKTMKVERSTQTLKSRYTARLTGRQIVEVRPQISGNIMRICINEGDKVHKGQPLFIIDQVPYRAALQVASANVESAKARLATAQLNMESARALENNKVVSDFEVKTQQNALQEARAALSLAKAQELNARNNLSYTVVRSAMNGVAGMIPYHVGALVSSSISEPLVTISDDSEIYAYFSITENQSIDLLQQYGTMSNFIKQTPSVELLMSNGKPYGHLGRIDAVSGIVDDNTGAVRIRATFPNNEHLLHNGGNAQVVISSVQNDCIVIPQSATYELQNRVFVYRIVDGKTKSTPVEVFRLNNGSDYVVTSGLKTGDIIVAEGAGLVKDGVEINTHKKQ